LLSKISQKVKVDLAAIDKFSENFNELIVKSAKKDYENYQTLVRSHIFSLVWSVVFKMQNRLHHLERVTNHTTLASEDVMINLKKIEKFTIEDQQESMKVRFFSYLKKRLWKLNMRSINIRIFNET
jgi:hypothetical protein